jgi:adenylate cyclase class 2
MKGRDSGGRENEVKLAVASAGAGRRLLRAAGFHVSKPRIFEINLVFDTPERRLLNAGALLRLRLLGKRGLLTYKGPVEPGVPHKTRLEVESEIADPEAVRFVLERLGYQPVFRYDKFRTEFARQRESGTATIDETPIGAFFELEGSPSWVDRSARRLGFSPADYITSSYGRLWSEHCQARGLPAADMLFTARRG